MRGASSSCFAPIRTYASRRPSREQRYTITWLGLGLGLGLGFGFGLGFGLGFGFGFGLGFGLGLGLISERMTA